MEFNEYLVKREKNAKDWALVVLIYAAAVIVAFCCITLLGGLGGLDAILAVAVLYGAYFLASKLSKEYEYVVTEDCVDIDIIYNASRRKRLISFSVKDVSVLACVKDGNHSSRINEQFSRVIDATSNRRDADVYFAILEGDGKTLVKFEPPHSFIEKLRKYAPLKVFVYQ